MTGPKSETLRALRQIDHEPLLAIVRDLPEWFTPEALRNIAVDLRYQHGYVAIQGDQTRGFLTFFVNEGVAQIAMMAVARGHHRLGIGTRLLRVLEDDLRSTGICLIRVLTLGDGVEYEPYARTRSFYLSRGFVESKRERTENPHWPEMLTLTRELR